MNQPFEKVGGRRFFMCIGCAIVCTFLVLDEAISDAIFRDIIIATVAVYIAGNTSQKVMGPKNDKKDIS